MSHCPLSKTTPISGYSASFRRLVASFVLCLGLIGVAHAQNSRYDGIVWSRNGFPSPGASVAVLTQPANTTTTPGTPLASLCSSLTDAVCTSPNPVTADSMGNFHFYVKPNIFTLQSYNSGLTPFIQSDIVLACTPTSVCTLGNGTVSLPALSFTSESSSGIYRAGSGDFRFSIGAVDAVRITAGTLTIPPTGLFCFGSSGVTSPDTCITRLAAGSFAFGNGGAGDTSGSLTATNFISASSNPASAGTIRLANSDIFKMRNSTNSADISVLSLASNVQPDQVKLGGSNGILVNGGIINSQSAITIAPDNILPCNHCSITLTASDGNAGGQVGGDLIFNPGTGVAAAFGKIQFGGGGTNPVGVASKAVWAYNTTDNKLYLSLNADTMANVERVNCVTSQKSESAADTNVLTCAPFAAAGSYRIRFTEAVSAQNTATLGWTATWKDANGSAQAPTNLSLFKSGTAAPALTFVVATNDNYYGYLDIDVDNSATAIVVKTTFAGTSFTSKVTATVERVN